MRYHRATGQQTNPYLKQNTRKTDNKAIVLISYSLAENCPMSTKPADAKNESCAENGTKLNAMKILYFDY